MRIRGKEIDFKLSRINDAAALDMAINKMGTAEVEIRKEKKLVAILSRTIGMFRQFFIDATGVDVLEGCEDLEEARAAYYEFLAEANKQKEAVINFAVSDIK